MKSKIACFSLLSLLVLTLFSFTSEEQSPDFAIKVYSRFFSYLDSFREEKVYLQTDKPYYSAGESIWFKGYVVNAATLKPESLSNFIYVELIDSEDEVVSRVKIERGVTGFSGHIALDQTISQGDYILRAYTQWMRNNSPEFFFSKNISVGNRIEDQIIYKATYGDVVDNLVNVSINFVDEHKIPVSDKKVEISGYWSGSRNRKMSLTTNSQGDVFFNLPVDTVNHLPKVLELVLDMKDYKFTSNLYIPNLSKDFDVQFFPESGVLLNNGMQSVAFKAIGANGMSRKVFGKVFSQNGEEILEIKTHHNGMGKFMLPTRPGESYYAIIQSEQGVEKRFELPALESEGLSLKLSFNNDKVSYVIINQLADQSTPLYLLIHSNGKPFVLAPLNNLKGQFSKSKLDVGIHAFSIVDLNGDVYCERLFFKNTSLFSTISMESDKDVYGKRELVNLSFKVQSEFDKTAEGFYSLSVTDSRFVKQDTINDNIISHLLLSSDIRGYIENPVSYFTNDSVLSHEKLDLLMLTQGWTRYKTSDILKGQQKHGDYLLEVGQTLTGKVLNIFGKPVKDRDVFGLVGGFPIVTKTNSLGEYIFDGIAFKDSVTFLLSAQKKGPVNVEIVPDVEMFPEPITHFISKNNEQKAVQNEYYDQSRLKFFSDGSMKHIYLDEFTVTARKRERVTNESSLGIMANVITSEELDKKKNMSLSNILRTLGVIITPNRISIKNNPSPPLLIIDDFPVADNFIENESFSETDDSESYDSSSSTVDIMISYLESIMTSDVKNIQILANTSTSIYGPYANNGIIAINTKSGKVNAPTTPINTTIIRPLGCQKLKQFYVPKYEVQSNRDDATPDFRTTIYWDPHLSSDSLGMVNVKFFTADLNNDYSVVLEGITKEGEICRYEGTIKRN